MSRYGHQGPNKPDKGKLNGSCNRTACQAPLADDEQWWMNNPTVENGRYYYCGVCAYEFNKWDDQIRTPRRCTIYEPETTRFKIEYLDPETQEPAVHEGEYAAWLDYTPRQVAEDHAYTLADKAMGSVKITEVR